MKCLFLNGTRLVWYSLMSMLKSLERRSEIVSEEITCAIMRFKLPYVGRSILNFSLQTR